MRRLEDGAEQQQALARVVVLRELQERLAQRRVAAELLGALDQPVVEPLFHGAQLGRELGVVSGRVADQIAGMHFEKARQQQRASGA